MISREEVEMAIDDSQDIYNAKHLNLLRTAFDERENEIKELTEKLNLNGVCEICEEKANKENVRLEKEITDLKTLEADKPSYKEAIQRIDALFDEAFLANHPAMHDYIRMKFFIKDLQKEIRAYERANEIYNTYPITRKQLKIGFEDCLKKARKEIEG